MTSKWITEYSKLADFISKHPEIKISPEIIRIPGNVKDQFYSQFDTVRKALVHHTVDRDFSDTNHLIKQYNKAADKVVQNLGLTEITGEKALLRFLADMNNWMERELFDPLFNALKGIITVSQLEKTAGAIVTTTIPEMHKKAYGNWIALSLINLLDADEIYGFNLPDLQPRDRVAVAPKGSYNPIVPPEKIGKIEFRYIHFELFTVPDFVIHSRKLNKYVSVRTHYENSVAQAANISQDREWFNMKVVSDLTSGMMLIYIDDELFNLALISDRDKFCRPDMIIEYRATEGWFDIEGFGVADMHSQSLKPVKGSWVVSSAEIPEADALQTPENIKVIDSVKEEGDLNPVVEHLVTV